MLIETADKTIALLGSETDCDGTFTFAHRVTVPGYLWQLYTEKVARHNAARASELAQAEKKMREAGASEDLIASLRKTFAFKSSRYAAAAEHTAFESIVRHAIATEQMSGYSSDLVYEAITERQFFERFGPRFDGFAARHWREHGYAGHESLSGARVA